jgi:serine/threonine protein kinase
VSSPLDHEDRLLQAARHYQTLLEEGARPQQAAFLQDFADLADELRPYLDALDALHVAAGLPSGPPREPPPADLAGLTGGIPLGDFQIVQEIGRGGMGVVYEATQLSLGRRVALKVLPFASALDARHLQRFKNEAQAAASLHHTNIVPVYAVGCERGVHFYAMQLIQGRTLAELIAEGRRSEQPRGSAETVAGMRTVPSGGTGSLGSGAEHYRGVARLMQQAALALEHAHQQGIIHRDVKPANLLVDGRGSLWVTDFGLAWFQDGLDLTRTGDLPGTLRYMSPEQSSGQRVLLDHRTDLYSLGATFYELLAGGPIFPGTTRAQLLQQIAGDDPRPLRHLRKGIPSELETIILKCLQKSPIDRYPDALSLADDLERFLDNRPIVARPPSWLDRTRKWTRRHPGTVGTAGLLLVLALGGLLVSHALLSREQAQTRQALAREQQRAEEAERRLQQTRQMTDLLLEVAEQELDDKPSLQGLRKRLLETVLQHYRQLEDDVRDDVVAADLAGAQERVRQILADLAALQGGLHAMFLGHPAVLRELAVSDEQAARIRAAHKELERARLSLFRDTALTLSQRRERQLAQARVAEQTVLGILTPTQRARLEQIALQIQGFLAFRDPEVVRKLHLTPKQRARIREIEDELLLSPHGPAGIPRPSFPPRSPWERLREGRERALALLMPEQKTLWTELTGPRFELPPPPFFGPRPFSPPPPPRR